MILPGGTLWEISLTNPTPETEDLTESSVRAALGEDSKLISSIQTTENSLILRAKPLNEATHQQLNNKLAQNFGQINEIRYESVGPTLGKELLKKTINAILFAASLILVLVAWQFKNLKFGLAAVIAMFHDTIILLGAFSVFGSLAQIEVDTLFVTAVLTVLSFSVHDTIVVFDRIREAKKLHPQAPFEQVVNKSIAETLSRSVNNSMTIIFMLLALFLLGGETIKFFILALLIGTISGTYSSTFTAAPLLVIFENIKSKKSHLS